MSDNIDRWYFTSMHDLRTWKKKGEPRTGKQIHDMMVKRTLFMGWSIIKEMWAHTHKYLYCITGKDKRVAWMCNTEQYFKEFIEFARNEGFVWPLEHWTDMDKILWALDFGSRPRESFVKFWERRVEEGKELLP